MEVPIKRDWAPAYRLRKASLASDQIRRSLDLAEESISVDPFHRDQRFELDGVVIDTNEPGMMVAFRIEPDGTITYLHVPLGSERLRFVPEGGMLDYRRATPLVIGLSRPPALRSRSVIAHPCAPESGRAPTGRVWSRT